MGMLPWLLDRLWHMVLPVVCLTYGGLAYLSRLTRASMLEVIREDYVRTARAKGCPNVWLSSNTPSETLCFLL